MEFGISFLPDRTPENLSPVAYYDDALELSVSAEQLGYRYVKMTEHYLRGYGGYCPAPLTFLAAVAARTSRIRLMTGGCLPVFHNPLQLASETAMVDAISHGRLEVGMARAYLPYEFEALGVAMDGSRERFNASVDAIVALWTSEAVTLSTPYFEFTGVTSLPRPVQQPHPPVLIAAVRSRESFERIGQLGYGLLVTSGSEASSKEHVRAYREEFLRHHGDSGAQPRVLASLPMLVGRPRPRPTRWPTGTWRSTCGSGPSRPTPGTGPPRPTTRTTRVSAGTCAASAGRSCASRGWPWSARPTRWSNGRWRSAPAWAISTRSSGRSTSAGCPGRWRTRASPASPRP
jgi:hypothetical protein